MVNEELVNYIRSQLSRNTSLKQIKQSLLSRGWPDADIDEAIDRVQQSTPVPLTPLNGLGVDGEQEVPTGVKIISVLYYIGAVIGIILGLLFFVGAEFIPRIETYGAGFFSIIGLVFIGIGVLGFLIGKGLWKARNWARIVAITSSSLAAISGIISIILGNIIPNILNLLLNINIIWYLLFNDRVKEVFTGDVVRDSDRQLPIKKSKSLWLIIIILVIILVSGGIYLSRLFTPLSNDNTPNINVSGAGSGFMSDKECDFTPGCRDINYPICFEGHCVKVNDQLRDYVFSKYQHGSLDQVLPDGVHAYGLFEEGRCEDFSCEGCRIGILLPAFIRDNNYEIRYCVECFGTGTSGCKDGYECLDGKCEET